MPLMPENSEFARKWQGVVKYHLDQGVGDPIVAYEYMNRFYVLEGNKRVSVLKYFHADSIEGMVTRMVPYPQDSIENQIYYEFMDFYKDSQINYLSFSKRGSFAQLTEAIGKKTGEKWTDDEKMDFRSLYNRFAEIFHAKGGTESRLPQPPTRSCSTCPFILIRRYSGRSTAEMKAGCREDLGGPACMQDR